jgi:putative spermidine/putrescine transport system ATP-binding protein
MSVYVPDLELSHVFKSYGEQAVVNDVSFALKKGEFLALLGPSGCGKTTTLSMIAGFDEPNSGAIKVRGYQIEKMPPEKRDIGMVLQSYALFPHMSIAQNIGFGLRMRRVPALLRKDQVLKAAQMVKVDHLLDRLPRQLSGGQQQRVALARALVVRPALLLLDEPFGALDRLLREEMQIEIRALLRELNITTIFVTHDQEEALSMADRVAVMHGGRIEQIDTPQNLYNVPQTDIVASFIGRGSFLSGIVSDAGDSFETAAGTFALTPAQGAIGAGPASYFLRPENIHALGAEERQPNETVGQIAATTFLGDRHAIVVEIAEGSRMLASTHKQSGAPQIGAAIRLGWNGADACLFRDGKRCTLSAKI